jgi:beta-galactosidase
VQLLSGSFHYARAPRALWRDRLQRLRALGLNAVQTYVPWNWHEATEGAFEFGGARDLAAFAAIAQEEGLLLLLRLGPYICGEWEFGGFPAWLLAPSSDSTSSSSSTSSSVSSSSVSSSSTSSSVSSSVSPSSTSSSSSSSSSSSFVVQGRDTQGDNLLIPHPPLTLRTFEAQYIAKVDAWFAALLPRVQPLLYANGGNVVMVQIENEYGSYGDVSANPRDKQYLEHLLALVRRHLGPTPIVYTTDGGSDGYMDRGSLKGGAVYTVGDHGPSSDDDNCAAMKRNNAPGMSPCMDSEYYTGWLTHWGEPQANISSAPIVKWLDDMLAGGASVNLYMGYGGSNFGFMNGANGDGQTSFQPSITSYDYSSPIAEGGEHGYGPDGSDKFREISAVLRKYQDKKTTTTTTTAAPPPLPREPPLPARRAYPSVRMTQKADLLSAAKSALVPKTTKLAAAWPIASDVPLTMEQIGQNYGFVLYEVSVAPPAKEIGFSPFPRDRAHVFVNGTTAIAQPMYRVDGNKTAPLTTTTTTTGGIDGRGGSGGSNNLQILVENMGRINYGHGMTDHKGIDGAHGEAVFLDGTNLTGPGAWKIWSLPLEYEQLQRLKWVDVSDDPSALSSATFEPTFFRGTFTIDTEKPADTYVSTLGWGKGLVWINGFNLGRFWEAMGPQHAMWLPSPLLRGNGSSNEIILLELDDPNDVNMSLSFRTTADLHGKNAPATCKSTAAGDVLRMYPCDSALSSQQKFEVDAGTGRIELSSTLSLSSSPEKKPLCLTVGPSKDAKFGFPLATLEACGSNPNEQGMGGGPTSLGAIRNAVSEVCLDVSNHDKLAGAPVGFYACTTGSTNQVWTLADTPDHGKQLISQANGFCLTAC